MCSAHTLRLVGTDGAAIRYATATWRGESSAFKLARALGVALQLFCCTSEITMRADMCAQTGAATIDCSAGTVVERKLAPVRRSGASATRRRTAGCMVSERDLRAQGMPIGE